MNLRPENKETLRDFYKRKNPSTQQEKLTVILYYLRHVAEIDGVSVDHIYTSLKDISERVPTNIVTILRNTSNRKGWIDSSDSASLITTTQGDNFVEHDLPATSNK